MSKLRVGPSSCSSANGEGFWERISEDSSTGSATGGGFHGESSVGMEGSLSAKSDGLSMVVGVVVCMGCCRFGGMATGEVRGKCEDRVE